MKVLVLAPPMGGVGGVQQYTTTLLRAFEEILGAANVRLIAVPGEAEARTGGSLALRRSVKARFLSRVIWQAMRWRPNLIVCTHLGVALAALRVKSSLRIPYLIVVHGIEVWGDLPSAKLRALRQAQRLIANSKFTLDATISRHKLAGKETSILPPAFQETELAASSVAIERPEGQEHVRPTVLTVGRLAASERYKGHDLMLDAWVKVREQIPDGMYVIVGDGNDRHRLETRAKELGIFDSVKFAGAISGAALHKYYQACHVFALPSRTDLDPRAPRGEGFGIVFLEAMSHGKPVVGPNSGAPAEFIHDREHGILVDPTKPQEIAEALIELLRHRKLAEQMGRSGKEWVRQEYSFEKFRARLKAILAAQAEQAR